MSDSDKKMFSKPVLWMIFVVSTLICFGFLFLNPSWFWIMLPFILTSLVYALDVA